MAWFLPWCACCWYWRFRPFRGFPGALAGLGGLQAGYKSSSKSKDSIRIDLRPQMWQLTSMAVCCGLVSFVVCVLWGWRFRPFRGFPGALAGLSGLQDGHLRCSKSEDSFRIDLRQKMWQSTSIVACFGLVSVVACVLLLVAISAVSALARGSSLGQRNRNKKFTTQE